MTSVWITSDIGPSSDPDDYQSLIHLLQAGQALEGSDYGLDIRGITTGKPRGQRKAAIEVLNAYQKDWNKYVWSHLPTATYYKSITRQRGTKATKALVAESKKHTPANPLLILVWGACTELREAIQSGLVVKNCFCFIIASWNREQDQASFDVVKNTKGLRKILCETSFRGMYMGAPAKLNNKKIIAEVGKFGELGKLLIEKSKTINTGSGSLKSGDGPSFLWSLTHKNFNPEKACWGGRFRRVDETTWTDRTEAKLKIGSYAGAKTVSRWQLAVRKDWLKKCKELYGG
jgi:hypothetical protein